MTARVVDLESHGVSALQTAAGSSCSPAWLWRLAFYAPSLLYPQLARALVVYRDGADVGGASVLKGAVFGGLQDAAVFLQTLVLVRSVLALQNACCCMETASRWRRLLVTTCTASVLAVAYLWMTLACVVDLSLLWSFLPRLNRGFVRMYLNFSSQFASSMAAVLTPRMLMGIALYLVSMALWVAAILGQHIKLPSFAFIFCQRSGQASTSSGPSSSSVQRGKRSSSALPSHSSSSASNSGLFGCLLQLCVMSGTFRTVFLALMVFVSALHSTIALDGDGNDIYLLSNAMFSLEMESFLRPPTRSNAAGLTFHPDVQTIQQHGDANSTMAPQLSPFLERTLGLNERLEFAEGGNLTGAYPLWRKTLGYTGEKRFDIRLKREMVSENSTETVVVPPTVILLNLESFRSREIGVIGGRIIKEEYNQTVTPFFDKLSRDGVLFREHYTPAVQTSRTLIASLFGSLPSLTDDSAVATFAETKLRLHGLTHILKQAYNYASAFWSAVNLTWEDWEGFLRAQGFDDLYDEDTILPFLSEKKRNDLTDDDRFSWGRHDDISFRALSRFLSKRNQQATVDPENTPPLFLDVYTVSSHDPWDLPSTFQPNTNYSMFITEDNEKYLNALNYVDQALERFITYLRTKGLMKNTILLLQGDHGYGRMEHGDNPTIVASRVYDEGTHVPLLVLADDLMPEEDKGRVIDDTTSQVDLLATITDMLEIKGFMQHGVGQSMMRQPISDAERAVVLENPFYGVTKGLKVGDRKYVRYGSGRYEVFNLKVDPEELFPVETGKATSGFHHNETKSAMHYLDQMLQLTQFMYETNGFVPSTVDEESLTTDTQSDGEHVEEAAEVNAAETTEVEGEQPKVDDEPAEGEATEEAPVEETQAEAEEPVVVPGDGEIVDAEQIEEHGETTELSETQHDEWPAETSIAEEAAWEDNAPEAEEIAMEVEAGISEESTTETPQDEQTVAAELESEPQDPVDPFVAEEKGFEEEMMEPSVPLGVEEEQRLAALEEQVEKTVDVLA
ncbi:hypothetical protein Poli38472_014721 [Pythium oligandrum]|uniref:Sulfatase N-terminal domain-containing protein n=1 Tax=Pythium oligandrum TaxID=41045 RepID=A0A8K1C1Y9_PYTOL|nr:hypothetical protein Poli38472_014721 [Pythium oligandrum]|eukprot:TMW54950.1 hypothetical protein Poli38472_014721 [Pythium oligandrum]